VPIAKRSSRSEKVVVKLPANPAKASASQLVENNRGDPARTTSMEVDKDEERSAKHIGFVINLLVQQSYLNLPHCRHNHWLPAESPEVRR
jgi:hypothetical protein